MASPSLIGVERVGVERVVWRGLLVGVLFVLGCGGPGLLMRLRSGAGWGRAVLLGCWSRLLALLGCRS